MRRTDGRRGDFFSYSVAVSGSTTVVGAPCHNSGTGAAHVFTRSGMAWSQHAADGATTGAGRVSAICRWSYVTIELPGAYLCGEWGLVVAAEGPARGQARARAVEPMR